MTDSFAPPWAQTIWVDATHLYVSISAKSGPPLIQKYSKTEGGLSKALEFANARFWAAQPKGGTSTWTPPQPNITKVPSRVNKENFTREQRANALDLLRKMGLA